MSGGKSLEYKS